MVVVSVRAGWWSLLMVIVLLLAVYILRVASTKRVRAPPCSSAQKRIGWRMHIVARIIFVWLWCREQPDEVASESTAPA